MKRIQMLWLAVLAMMVIGCGDKKKSDDIIAPKAEQPKLQAPIRMQDYAQTTNIKWLDKNYQVEIRRVPDDSLRMVKDETGQKFVDNRISLRILRADGSVFFSRSFTKAAFDAYLDNDYRQTGILEGLVFDKVEGANLFFAASVCHPQTDEYIPMIVSVSSLGDIGIRRDSEMDTNGGDNAPSTNTNDEDEV
ncbi:MAG: DUF4738 domain-containing protein [Prevotella sp.]|nr:DUF4738 domain-containing protein [Prevotella sp.]